MNGNIPINHIIFWKTVIRTFRCVYVNCCNKIRFLSGSVQNCKNTLFSTIKNQSQEGNMETRQMIRFFSSTLSPLTVCNIHFYIWKWCKFIFMWSPFGLFWSIKYLNFGQKLPIPTAHDTFLERRHPEVTKNPNYVLHPKGNQTKVSAHGPLI